MKTFFKISMYVAITVIVTGCEKLNDTQIKIRITDIPAEYNGRYVQSYLEIENDPDPDYNIRADSYQRTINNSEVTTEMFTVAPAGYDYIQPVPFTDKGEYIFSFYIAGDGLEFEGIPGTTFYWGGETAPMKITQGNNTISFNKFKTHEDITYPYTYYRYEESSFDKSSVGRYRGVIAGVGLSGTVDMEVFNNSNIAKARITIGSQTDELTCTSALTFQQVFHQKIVNATFKGSFSSFTFSVGGDGRNPVIENISIDGHENVSAVVLKNKYYYGRVECYEGIFSGDCNGVFNVASGLGFEGRSIFAMLSKGDDGITFSSDGEIYQYGGANPGIGFNNANATTVFNGINYSFDFTGRFVEDNLNGTWKNTWNEGTSSGTFSCKKTL